jgi:endonuclease/exonuclease/phosphatase (EEP) superfamily protein YafD
MAAIFALIFVPAMAAVLFMIGTLHRGISIATVSATLIFVALATGIIVGLVRLMNQWESAET